MALVVKLGCSIGCASFVVLGWLHNAFKTTEAEMRSNFMNDKPYSQYKGKVVFYRGEKYEINDYNDYMILVNEVTHHASIHNNIINNTVDTGLGVAASGSCTCSITVPF